MAEVITQNPDGCEYIKKIACGGPNGCAFYLCGKQTVMDQEFSDGTRIRLCSEHILIERDRANELVEQANNARFDYKCQKVA